MARKEEERLYFIIRSLLLSWIAGAQFLIFVIIFGYIDLIRAIIVGTIIFVTSLAISRAFEGVIDRAVVRIMKVLRKYPKLRAFILRYF